MGFPTIITMFNIKYTGNIIKARLLLYNPITAGVWFTIKAKAFSGTPNSQTLFGLNYVGFWNFPSVFQTMTVSINSGVISDYLYYTLGS